MPSLLKRRKAVQSNPGKLRQHQTRKPVVNNGNVNRRTAATPKPPSSESLVSDDGADAARETVEQTIGRAQHEVAARRPPKERRLGGCCGSRPDRKSSPPKPARPAAVTVSVYDTSTGTGGDPVIVRLAVDDLRLENLRRRLGTVVRISEDTTLQCLADNQWLTILNGQDQLLLDVMAENGDSTLLIKVNDKGSPRGAGQSAGHSPFKGTDESRSGKLETALMRPPNSARPDPSKRVRTPLSELEPEPEPARHSGRDYGNSVPDAVQVRTASGREAALDPNRAPDSVLSKNLEVEQVTARTMATDVPSAGSGDSHFRDVAGRSVVLQSEFQDPDKLTQPSTKASPTASAIASGSGREQTFVDHPSQHMNEQVVGTNNLSGVSALQVVQDISARLGQVEAELQGARQRKQRSHEKQKRGQQQYGMDALLHPTTAVPTSSVPGWNRRSPGAAPLAASSGSPSSSLPRTHHRSPRVASHHFTSTGSSHTTDHTSQRLLDLQSKATQVHDELRRARETRYAGRGRESDWLHGRTDAASGATTVPVQSVPVAKQQPRVTIRSPTRENVISEPGDIAKAQLASLRAEFSKLSWERSGSAAVGIDRNGNKRDGRELPSNPRNRTPKTKIQVFDPKSPRGPSFGATRQVRFPSEANASAGHRSIRRGSPNYDWTFE